MQKCGDDVGLPINKEKNIAARFNAICIFLTCQYTAYKLKTNYNIIINPRYITPYPNNINTCTRYNAKLMQGDVASRLKLLSSATMIILADYVPRQEIQKTNDIPNK